MLPTKYPSWQSVNITSQAVVIRNTKIGCPFHGLPVSYANGQIPHSETLRFLPLVLFLRN